VAGWAAGERAPVQEEGSVRGGDRRREGGGRERERESERERGPAWDACV